MRGKVLDFSIAEGRGLISGDDGQYGVDFVGLGGSATAVCVDVGTPSSALADDYSGLYRSTDEKMLLGLCAGLAHKFGLNVTLVRVGMFLITMLVLWFPYLIGFFLPAVPTRNVPRQR